MPLLHQLPAERWTTLGGQHTAREINQQPQVWQALREQLGTLPAAVRQRSAALLGNPAARVLLTGAGTSSFVGEIMADSLDSAWPARIGAVSTTTLLSHPALYLTPGTPLLLVSFARSGNSPESQAVVDLVRSLVPQATFLNITCNPEGLLARDGKGREDTLNLVLPPACCDQGFAMTSSFSTMLLAALAVLGPEPLPVAQRRLDDVSALARQWLQQHAASWHEWGRQPAQRIVYLAGGPQEALAREAALKVLELSGGRILALANTPLGFRHGPKSVLDKDTLVVMFRSQQAHARRYEQDLLDELERDRVAGAVLALDAQALGAPAGLPDTWLAVCYAVFAQVLALHQSVRLGLTPDNPFPDGTVNRVVQGVTVHAYANA